jgi:sugar/nucleoside kinase (ribokinase family)
MPHVHVLLVWLFCFRFTFVSLTFSFQVITQGRDPTIVAIEGKVSTYPVILIPESSIVDTTGAGDAFSGGYLAGVVLGKNVEECVQAGAYVASVVIQQSGPVYPREKADFSWSS